MWIHMYCGALGNITKACDKGDGNQVAPNTHTVKSRSSIYNQSIQVSDERKETSPINITFILLVVYIMFL